VLTTREIAPADEARVLDLAKSVAAADGIDPLNEAALFALHTPGSAVHWLAEDAGTLVGYALWHVADASALVLVHPEHRRRGIGRSLLAAVAAHAGDDLAVWAFGDLPPARAFTAASGLAPTRGLHQMMRPLVDLRPARFPAGVTVRGYTPGDLAALHAMNAAAFATHPEQGHLTLDDLRQRMDEPWFDPDGLILAFAADTPLGFHWTKRESPDVGEVYVLGVVPEAGGRGLGTALLWAGLDHLQRSGCRDVDLFVDADNLAAVQLYERAGFAVVRTDTLYRPTQRGTA
jgi:mycothiol synthase